MELRWVYYHGAAPQGAPAIYLGQGPQQYSMVLQFRDGVTHDAPWQDVPIVIGLIAA